MTRNTIRIIPQSIMLMIGNQRYEVTEDANMTPGTVKVFDARRFVEALASTQTGVVDKSPASARRPEPAADTPAPVTRLGQVHPVATPTGVKHDRELAYQLLPRTDDSQLPMYAKTGHRREAIAAAIWKHRNRFEARDFEIACWWLGIDRPPMTTKEIAPSFNTSASTLGKRLRQMMAISGLIPKVYQSLSDSMHRTRARERDLGVRRGGTFISHAEVEHAARAD